MIDPLSMRQLAESLANELWSQQPPPQEQRPTTGTGFSFVGGSAATGVGGNNNNNLMSFTDDGSSSSLPTQLTEKKAGSGRRASLRVKEHVVAERKRREKMNHQFATLASIVPDITKVRRQYVSYVYMPQERHTNAYKTS